MSLYISYSRANLYAKCPQAHWYRYVEKLQPKGIVRALQFGTDFHSLLEVRNDDEKVKEALESISDNCKGLSPKNQQELGETYLEDISAIFEDYMQLYGKEELPDATEKPFRIPLGRFKGEAVYFTGFIDGIYDTADGLVIEEHKTFSTKPDPTILTLSQQKCLYIKALEKEYGDPPFGVIWDYVRSTPAKVPAVLKNGTLSKAKSTTITPMSYRRAVEAQETVDAGAYLHAEAYTENIENFYFRVKQRNLFPDLVNQVWDDFKTVSKDIARNGGQNRQMNMSRDCSWCSFRPICMAFATGQDVKAVKKQQFKEQEYRK